MRSFLLNISRDMMKSRLNLKPISSALLKGLATMVSDGKGFHPKVLSTE
jgi:hypothetical protein